MNVVISWIVSPSPKCWGPNLQLLWMWFWKQRLCGCNGVQMRSLGWSLIHCDPYLYKKRKPPVKTGTQRECHVTREIAVMQLQAQDHQGLTATSGSSEEARNGSFQSHRGSMVRPTPSFQSLILDNLICFQNYETINICCSKVPSLWYFVTVTLGN